jgi:hypothetical protein
MGLVMLYMVLTTHFYDLSSFLIQLGMGIFWTWIGLLTVGKMLWNKNIKNKSEKMG